MELAEYQGTARVIEQGKGSRPRLEIASMLGLASETGSVLEICRKYLHNGFDLDSNRALLREELGNLLWYVASLANAFDLNLDDIAETNLARRYDQHPPDIARRTFDEFPAFDAVFPLEERFPRRLTFRFVERATLSGRPSVAITLISAEPNAFPEGPVTVDGGRYIGYQVGGPFGDPLSDNGRRIDGYRYHDAIHFGFLTALNWSPNTRSLLHVKRKSDPIIDECEDGARAIFAEEGLAAVLSRLAADRAAFQSEETIDREVMSVVRAATTDLEVESLLEWLWRRAIRQGFHALQELAANKGGYLVADLDARTLTYRKVIA